MSFVLKDRFQMATVFFILPFKMELYLCHPFLVAFTKLRKRLLSYVIFVHLHVTTRLTQGGFS